MSKQPTRLSDFQIPREEVLQKSPVAPSPAPVVHPGFNNADMEPIGRLGKPGIEVGEGAAASAALAPREDTMARIAPRPPAEPRQALTVRLPVSMHERVRTLMFVSRRSQQDIVEEALDAFLKKNEV